ncbi:APC family permease [Phormidesmis sp. 146-33]
MPSALRRGNSSIPDCKTKGTTYMTIEASISPSKALKHNALSMVDTVTLAVAGSAPSYSLNATTATLVAAVGLASPGALLYAAIPMFGISFAFMYLNQWRSDAGASYAWVGRTLKPSLGFLSGWTFLSLSTIFMAAAAVPIGVATLGLFSTALSENVVLATIIGSFWLVSVATITVMGVSLAARFQKIMTGIEVISLIALAIGALVKFSANPVNPFSWSWFAPTQFGNLETFMAGMLVATFYYFGWDVSSNVSEETQNSNSTPGYSGVIGMVGVFLLFQVFQVLVQVGMTPDQIEKAGANLLGVLGDMVLPRPWGNIAVLAVLVSTVGTIETQLTQCSRTLFSMARDRVISRRFEEIHPTFQTPWLGTFVISLLALSLLVASSSISTINELMAGLIQTIGVQVAFYYAMTGFACTWYYRRQLRQNFQTLLMKGICPFTSAIFLLVVGIYQLTQFESTVVYLSIGAIAIGILPMLYYRWKYQSSFYSAAPEAFE